MSDGTESDALEEEDESWESGDDRQMNLPMDQNEEIRPPDPVLSEASTDLATSNAQVSSNGVVGSSQPVMLPEWPTRSWIASQLHHSLALLPALQPNPLLVAMAPSILTNVGVLHPNPTSFFHPSLMSLPLFGNRLHPLPPISIFHQDLIMQGLQQQYVPHLGQATINAFGAVPPTVLEQEIARLLVASIMPLPPPPPVASLVAQNMNHNVAQGPRETVTSSSEPLQQQPQPPAAAAAAAASSHANVQHPSPPPSPPPQPSNKDSKVLYMDSDEETLSEYQCFLRKQLEIFEAGKDDIRCTAQGRNTAILLKQVGVRCRHCAPLPRAAKTKGAVYYSRTIGGIYQIAQNMSKVHLCERCQRIPSDVRKKLNTLRVHNRRAACGIGYWSDGLRALGVYEDGQILRLRKPVSSPTNASRRTSGGKEKDELDNRGDTD